MLPIIIGVVSGLLIILIFICLHKLDKPTLYALVLVGIAFLYVGFTWSDITALIVACIQAIGFILIAYFGIKKMQLLALGYFLHGLFDLLYGIFPLVKLLPPHYDYFCISIDFTVGFYLLGLNWFRRIKSTNLQFIL